MLYSDIKGGKLERSGYASHFKTEKEAVDYKWKQLERIRVRYAQLNERLPDEYGNQIKQMEREYGKGKGKEIQKQG